MKLYFQSIKLYFLTIKLYFQSIMFCASSTENGQRNGGAGAELPVAEHAQSLYEVLASLSKLGIIMAYFFLCDR